jgi:hypothetical protein
MRGGHVIKLVIDERGGLLCKKSVGKILLSFILSVLAGGILGCTEIVTLPVRTVIDLTDRPIKIEAGSTIDLIEKPEVDGANYGPGPNPSPKAP